MELEVVRRYYPKGTNGELYIHSSLQCYTIELPWKENLPNISCIPEGRYRLQKRYSHHHGKHLEVLDVPGRKGILVHGANDALKELRGCIAPVSRLTGEGHGIHSRLAFGWILSLLSEALEREPIFLIIKSIQHDSTTADAIADTRLF